MTHRTSDAPSECLYVVVVVLVALVDASRAIPGFCGLSALFGGFSRRTPNTTNQPTFDTNAHTTTNTEGCYKDGQDSPKVEKTKRANRFSS